MLYCFIHIVYKETEVYVLVYRIRQFVALDLI